VAGSYKWTLRSSGGYNDKPCEDNICIYMNNNYNYPQMEQVLTVIGLKNPYIKYPAYNKTNIISVWRKIQKKNIQNTVC